MLKIIFILLPQLLLINCKALVDPSLPTDASSVTLEDVAFIKLGTYRGFTDDGTEYQKSYFISRYSYPPWAESRSFCNSYNLEFLTLETLAEQQSYLTMLDSSTYLRSLKYAWLWIDSVSVGSTSNWYWTKSGKKILFPISWFPGEPNNSGGNEFCLVIGKRTINEKFTFSDAQCGNLANAACQKIEFSIP